MYRNLDDFFAAYTQLSEGTLKLLNVIQDKDLDQEVAEDHRSLRQIAWHVVTCVPEMMNRVGLGISSVDHESSPPDSASDLASSYQKVSQELTTSIKANWKDATLEETDDMYGQKWKRGFTLAVLCNHEIHHCGQLTVLMRQAGVVVPGLYGPSKEEWTQFGMEAPPY